MANITNNRNTSIFIGLHTTPLEMDETNQGDVAGF